jgi:Zn finger protein HypA/HybF involved in hydrogenase expression
MEQQVQQVQRVAVRVQQGKDLRDKQVLSALKVLQDQQEVEAAARAVQDTQVQWDQRV